MHREEGREIGLCATESETYLQARGSQHYSRSRLCLTVTLRFVSTVRLLEAISPQ
jgi:hypothetical protein